MDVSVDVVDSNFGRPAEGIGVTLLREVNANWKEEESAVTDDTGFAFLLSDAGVRGRYRLRLDLDKYFSGLGVVPFQSSVEISFRVFSSVESVPFIAVVTPLSSYLCRVMAGVRERSDAMRR